MTYIQRLFLAFVLTLCGVFTSQSAMAQTVDFSPVVHFVFAHFQEAVVLSLSALAGLVLESFRRLIGVKADQDQRQALHDAIDRGVALTLGNLHQELGANAAIEIGAPVTAAVANYVLRFSPHVLKHFKLTSDDLEPLIRARIGALLIDHDPPKLGT